MLRIHTMCLIGRCPYLKNKLRHVRYWPEPAQPHLSPMSRWGVVSILEQQALLWFLATKLVMYIVSTAIWLVYSKTGLIRNKWTASIILRLTVPLYVQVAPRSSVVQQEKAGTSGTSENVIYKFEPIFLEQLSHVSEIYIWCSWCVDSAWSFSNWHGL